VELDTVVLTGATGGIGRAAARLLAVRARTLLLHGPEPREQIEDLIGELRGPEVVYLRADYGDLDEVRNLAAAIRESTGHIDVLINNAGIPGPPRWTGTRDDNELTLQTNYLAATVLTGLLLDVTTRVVNVASATHLSATLRLDDLNLRQHRYDPVTAYARSKLALVTYSCWLAGQLSGRRTVVSMHPGVISTPLLHSMFTIPGDPAERGATNILHAATASDANGVYFDESTPAQPHPDALDPQTQERLHRVTTVLTGRVGGAPVTGGRSG
jgi:NAD(P)-dependent dehydrogenase (short-subunit alcohol dehydrogenase family)